jgi:hypothetical protein
MERSSGCQSAIDGSGRGQRGAAELVSHLTAVRTRLMAAEPSSENHAHVMKTA